MAKRTATTQTQAAAPAKAATTDKATFCITGTLDSVFTGKKYNYATVKVMKSNGFYDQYKVQCSLDFDFPDDGQQITLTGYINRYKTDITFVDASCVSNT